MAVYSFHPTIHQSEHLGGKQGLPNRQKNWYSEAMMLGDYVMWGGGALSTVSDKGIVDLSSGKLGNQDPQLCGSAS